MEKPLSEQWRQHVFPHGPLRQIAPHVWVVTGTMGRSPIPRNMVVHRLSDGTLWLHSVIALNEKGIAELEKLGTPSVMVVPNAIHRADAAVYKERYPGIRVLCPAAAREKVAQVVGVDGTTEEALVSYGIDCLKPAGLKPFELVYVLKTSEGKVLVVADCLMNLSNLPGIQGIMFRILGSTGFFGITAIGRWLLLRDRAEFAKWLAEAATFSDLRAICVGHGAPITEKCSEALLSARARLVR